MLSANEPASESINNAPDWTFEELVVGVFQYHDTKSHQEYLAYSKKMIARGYLSRFPVAMYLVKRSELPDPPSDGPYLPSDEDSCWCHDESGLYEISSNDYRDWVAEKKGVNNFAVSWIWHRFTDGYRYLNTFRSHRRQGNSTRSRITRGDDGKVQFVDTVELGRS